MFKKFKWNNKNKQADSILGLLFQVFLGFWFLTSPIVSAFLVEILYNIFSVKEITNDTTLIFVGILTIIQMGSILIIENLIYDFNKEK